MIDKKNIYLFLAAIVLGIVGCYLYRRYFEKKPLNTMLSNNNNDNKKPIGDIEYETTNPRIIYDDPTLDPGEHISYDPVYGEENSVDIVYGFHGFGENSPTNLSVPLLSRDKQIYIMNPNANKGVIKDYV